MLRGDNMADIKWVKLSTDTLEDEKIQYLEGMPEGKMLFGLWIKLIITAGRCNQGGYLFVCDNVPYTEESLANKFREPQSMIRLALNIYSKLGMIETIDGVIHLTNWSKHQNVESLDKIREQTRLRVAKHRAQLLLPPCNVTSNVTETLQPQYEDIKNKNKNIEQCNVTSTLHHDDDDNIFKFYEDNFGKLSDYIVSQLKSLLEDYTPQRILEAMKESIGHNGRNLSYLKTVLSNGNGHKKYKHNGGNGHKPEQQPPRYKYVN